MYIFSDQKIPLCLHCYSIVVQIQQQQLESQERMLNYLSDEMAFATGIPVGPRFPPRPRPIIAGRTTLNNISVRDSVVGSINTGTIGSVDVDISVMKKSGNADLSEAFTQLTDAIVNSDELNTDQKNEAIEILSFISHEAVTQKAKRRATTAKSLLSRFKDIISVTGGLTTLWQEWGQVILKLFN